MPTAFSILPERFADARHAAIETGLKKAGWRVEKGFGLPRGGDDLLVTWTRHRGHRESCATAFEAAGGRVAVCEEGYIREVRGRRHFALALDDHNGAGRWRVGDARRWESFGIAPAPWRRGGRTILLREQRGIGSARMASPPLWHDDAARRLERLTQRPVVFRPHPRSRLYAAAAKAQPPLDAALAEAHAVVTWASSLAVQALIAGVPVFYEAPHIVCAGACTRGLEEIDDPPRPDRRPAFERLAWAQWSLDEIASGDAFRFLLAE